MEALLPDGKALSELGRLHQPLYRKITRHFGGDRVRLIERSALAVATLTVLLGETLTLLTVDLLRSPSPFLWLVLALGGLLFAATIAKGFELWIKRDHASPRRGLDAILALSGLTLLTGLGGLTVDLYRIAAVIEASPDRLDVLTPARLVGNLTLVSVAMLLALAGALAWFVFHQWLTQVSRARSEALGLPTIEPR